MSADMTQSSASSSLVENLCEDDKDPVVTRDDYLTAVGLLVEHGLKHDHARLLSLLIHNWGHRVLAINTVGKRDFLLLKNTLRSFKENGPFPTILDHKFLLQFNIAILEFFRIHPGIFDYCPRVDTVVLMSSLMFLQTLALMKCGTYPRWEVQKQVNVCFPEFSPEPDCPTWAKRRYFYSFHNQETSSSEEEVRVKTSLRDVNERARSYFKKRLQNYETTVQDKNSDSAATIFEERCKEKLWKVLDYLDHLSSGPTRLETLRPDGTPVTDFILRYIGRDGAAEANRAPLTEERLCSLAIRLDDLRVESEFYLNLSELPDL